ncbi:hypothetical protein C2W62_02210 [Candidatus Entotheonella serta]|nr:hypothetical protein C2W62_02210 [Candidatus Entotheonella serta]
MSGDLFLFVYNDQFGKIRNQAQANVTSLSDQLCTVELLNLQNEELLAMTYPDGTPTWEPLDVAGEFLTTVAVRTILNHIGLPFVAIGESQVLNQDMDSLGVQASDTFMIGISTTFIFDVYTLETLIHQLKSQFPNVPVLIGGAGFTLNPDWFAQCSADFGLFGDAEEALHAFVEVFCNGRDFAAVPNLYYKTPFGSVCPGQRRDIDIDTAPTPIWDQGRGWPSRIWYESLRGCPFRCKFCSYPQQSPDWRVKSADRMFEEWMYYAENGVRYITCLDSTMLTPPTRMKRFCELLIQHQSPIQWNCWGHPSQLQSFELIELMAAAGCCSLSMGVESGDDHILKNMSKFVSRTKSLRAIEYAKRAGLFTIGNFMIGFPGETQTSIDHTRQLILEAAPDIYSTQAFQIRDRHMPILAEAGAYHLDIQYDAHGVYQSWQHETMSSQQAEQFVHDFEYQLLHQATRSLSFWSTRAMGFRLSRGATKPQLTSYRQQHLNPLMKELERAAAYHPMTQTPYNIATCLSTSRRYAQTARLALSQELKNDRLVSPQSHQLIQKLEA